MDVVRKMAEAITYYIPENTVVDETIVKNSRFICHLNYVADTVAAKHFIQSLRQQYPDARHHCSAFIAGAPNNSQCLGSSDDGEPGGTAGRPMLAVLQGSEIGEICAVVVRYFGGIKLGAGGLVRAYSHSAQQVYEEVVTETNIHRVEYDLRCEFSDEQSMRHWLKLHEGVIQDTQYSERVTLLIALE